LEKLKKQQEKEIKKTLENTQTKKVETEKKHSPRRTLIHTMTVL
jgi:hypothetical protein